MSLFELKSNVPPKPSAPKVVSMRVRTDEDLNREIAADRAWSKPETIANGTGTDEITARRIAKEVADPAPITDKGIRTFSDIIPAEDMDGILAATGNALLGTDSLPDMERAHQIGKHVINVASVEPTPMRIEVHLGTHTDVA